MTNWIPRNQEEAPENTVVETIVLDSKGERNEQPLKRVGGLWFFPNMSMYVYYEPTHWRKKMKAIK